MPDSTAAQLERISSQLERLHLQVKGLEIRLDTIEDQLDMAAVTDIEGALEEVRAQVRSIKDEML